MSSEGCLQVRFMRLGGNCKVPWFLQQYMGSRKDTRDGKMYDPIWSSTRVLSILKRSGVPNFTNIGIRFLLKHTDDKGSSFFNKVSSGVLYKRRKWIRLWPSVWVKTSIFPTGNFRLYLSRTLCYLQRLSSCHKGCGRMCDNTLRTHTSPFRPSHSISLGRRPI